MIKSVGNKKRILIDLSSLYDHLSGIERYALEMAHAMIKNGNDYCYTLVFKNEIHFSFKECNYDNVDYIVIKGGNKLFFNQIKLLKMLKKTKADVYLFPAFPEPLLFSKGNIYTTIHDLGCFDSPYDMKFLNRLYFKNSYRHTFKKARHIFTVSEFSKGRICQVGNVTKDRVTVTYDAVTVNSTATYSSKDILRKYEITDNYILSLSTIEPRKNLNLLLDAYEMLLDKNDASSLPDIVLAGRQGWKMEGFLAKYSNELRNKIIITGFIDDNDLEAVYKNAKFFVFPSKYEGFGIPPLEAMHYGVPVLASDAASMPEILGDAAVYFKTQDKADLLNGLEYMINLKAEERDNLISKGKNQSELYSWEEEAMKILNVIAREI